MANRTDLTAEEQDQISKVYETYSFHGRWLLLSCLIGALMAGVVTLFVGSSPIKWLFLVLAFSYGASLPAGWGCSGSGSALTRLINALLKGPFKLGPRLLQAKQEVQKGNRYLKAHFSNR